MQTTVRVQCRDQALQVNAPKLASGGVKEIKMEFSFCPLWDGYGKTAVFYREGGKPIDQVIDNENSCLVPSELLKDPGYIYFGVFGSLDGVTRTTEVVKINLLQGPPMDGAMPEEPTPNIYEQLLSEMGKAVTIDLTGDELEDIDLPESDPVVAGNAVLYDKQALTPEQQAQARENIGAASAEDVESVARAAAEAGAAAGKANAAVGEAKTAANEAKQAATDNVTNHNTNTAAHADIRVELKALSDRINAALDSDDTTLDELSEIVAYIKSNKSLIDAITTSKVSVSDIVNNLVTNVTNKPLSAAQGVALKALIDAAKATAEAASETAGEAKSAAAEAKAAATAANITEFKELTDDQRTAARVNISAVSYEANQGLNDFARHNARTNIKAVSYEPAPQTSLTNEEKAQARANIGAVTVEEVIAALPVYSGEVV